MMRQRRWTREQIILAWVISVAFHAAVLILVCGGVKIIELSQPAVEQFDTRVPGADLPDEVAFDVSDPRPRVRSAPVSPKEAPTQPPRKELVSSMPAPKNDPSPKAWTTPVPGDRSSDGSDKLPAPSARALHSPVNPGKSIVYVVDRSSSMGTGGKLAQAIACIRLSLRELSPDARFLVVAYHSNAEVLNDGEDLVAATPANIATAEAALEELTPIGGSEHLTGLRKGLSFQPDALFVLTDADDLKADHLRIITAANRRTVIYPVLFGAPRNGANSPFDALARQNRGVTQVIASRP
jgi:hypothetical protein